MRGGHRVVDAHVHVNRFDLMAPGPRAVIEQNPTFPLMERFMRDPDAFLAHMDAEGIDQAWLINYCAREVMGYGREVNPWVADYVMADPDRLVAVGGYDPREDGPGDRHVDWLRELGVSAVKFHPVHMRLSPDHHRRGDEAGERLAAAYKRMEALRMPLIVHTGTSIFPGADNALQHVSPIGAVCQDHPDLPVVLAHGGRPNECGEALQLLEAYPNAHLELSSLPPKRIPEWFGDLRRPVGGRPLSARCIWGSDWPGPKVPGMGANVDAFLALGFSPAVNEQVLHGTAERLLAAVL